MRYETDGHIAWRFAFIMIAVCFIGAVTVGILMITSREFCRRFTTEGEIGPAALGGPAGAGQVFDFLAGALQAVAVRSFYVLKGLAVEWVDDFVGAGLDEGFGER